MSWGINENAPQREKIFARYADDIQGLNSVGTVDYKLYSYLFDIGRELADKSYEQGKKDAVVHAHWTNERSDVGYLFAEYRYECSACGGATEFAPNPKTSYCPYCGAKMDEKKGEEK